MLEWGDRARWRKAGPEAGEGGGKEGRAAPPAARGGRRRCRDDQRRLQLGRAAGHAPAGEVRRREQM
jgi:hypothetical protein